MFKKTFKKIAQIATLAAIISSGALMAHAACYVDYKAKRDNPLQLHYGVIELSDDACASGATAAQISARIAADGWLLLNVLSQFGSEGLEQRRESAGQYYLRY